MDDVSDERLRQEVRKLLRGVDLRSTSVGQLRATLEKSLGLASGALEEQKDEVQRIITQEIADGPTAEPEEADAKKPGAGASQPKDGEGTRDKKKLKDKKEPKVKKEKKDKKEKKEDKEDGKKKRKAEVLEEQPAKAAAEAAAAAAEGASSNKVPEEEEEEQEGLEAAEVSQAEMPEVPVASVSHMPAPVTETFERSDVPTFSASQEADSQEPISHPSRRSAMVLSGSEDGTLRLWDLELETKGVRVLEGHTGTVHSLAVNWETFEAISGADDSCKLWDLKLGGCQKTMAETPEGCTAVEADWPGRTAVAGCGDGSLRVWFLPTAEVQTSQLAHRGGVWALHADFKAGRLVSAGDGDFKLWDVRDWTCLYTSPGHAGGLMCISVDWASSQLLAGAGSSSSRLQLWSFDSEAQMKDRDKQEAHLLQGHQDVVADLAVDWKSGNAVTAGWDAQLIMWNVEKRAPTQSYECKFGRVRSLAVDFNMRQALCGSSSGSLHLMELHNGFQTMVLEGHGGAVTAINAQRMVA